MRFIVSPEQQTFFFNHGYIEFENLVTPPAAQEIVKSITAALNQIPGHSATHLLRTVPSLLPFIKKYLLAKIANELVLQKPLRLSFDQYSVINPKLQSIKSHECGLLIFLNSSYKCGHGIYFRGEFPKELLLPDPQARYLFLVFSNKQLHNTFQPIVHS